MPEPDLARSRLVAQGLVRSHDAPENAVGALGALQGQDLPGVLASAALRTRAGDVTAVLDAIAPALKPLPNSITVEGHTDDVPISGTYRSNWALSADRAVMVTERLIRDGIPTERVAAAGYADTRPLAPNTSDAGRARNRRVAVVVLPFLPQQEAESGLAAADRTPGGPNIAPSLAPAAPKIAPSIATPRAPAP